MAVLVLPIHPSGGIVQVLPGAAGQPSLVHPILLGVELALVLDQQVGDLSGRDPEAHLAEPLQDFGLGHLAGEGKDDGQRPHPWPELPIVA